MSGTLLLIVPHADDEIFFSGTLLKYSDLGYKTYVLVTTNGDKGKVVDQQSGELREPYDFEKPNLIKIRKRELKNAMKLLKIGGYQIWNEPTRTRIINRSLINKLKRNIVRINPSVIISYSEAGNTLHQDHIVFSISIFIAIKELIKAKLVPNFLRYLTLVFKRGAKTLTKYGELKVANKLLTKVKVQDYVVQKRLASNSHKSQKHIVEALSRAGVISAKYEYFYERIGLRNFRLSGVTNLFEEKDSIREYYFDILPKNLDSYTLSNSEHFLKWSDAKSLKLT